MSLATILIIILLIAMGLVAAFVAVTFVLGSRRLDQLENMAHTHDVTGDDLYYSRRTGS